MERRSNEETRQAVRKRYGQIARSGSEKSCSEDASCCGQTAEPTSDEMSVILGYSREDVSDVPEGANMGLGCGNPQAIAALQPGETVLDLGSGGGFDCFLAAKAVGSTGCVIGVDMTADMVRKARDNAVKGGFRNVEFRLGEIEHIPVADKSVDVIISNCVINLSPDKQQVFADAFRVLKPGGRLAISDIVATAPLPDPVKDDLEQYTGCVAGAALIDDLVSMLEAAGFSDVRITSREESRAFIREWTPGGTIEDYIVSAAIEAVRH